MKIALAQMLVKPSPEENIGKIREFIRRGKAQGAELILFPEICCCYYESTSFVRYAMEADSSFLQEIAQTAKEYGVFVVAGSVPERRKKKIYNTAFVFDPTGKQVAKHRKMHLFDIDVEGGQYFKESDTFTAGQDFTLFDTPWGKMGLAICYDIRFPEVCRMLAMKGAKGILIPAAFNMTTGPAHWELSFRARALDNQVFLAGVSPARDAASPYTAWGHSLSTDPWGEVLVQMDEREGLAFVEWDMARLEKVRRELPLLAHMRTDLYCVAEAPNSTNNRNWAPPLEFILEKREQEWRRKNEKRD